MLKHSKGLRCRRHEASQNHQRNAECITASRRSVACHKMVASQQHAASWEEVWSPQLRPKQLITSTSTTLHIKLPGVCLLQKDMSSSQKKLSGTLVSFCLIIAPHWADCPECKDHGRVGTQCIQRLITLYHEQFKTMVRSKLEYCCPLWRPTKVQDIKALENVQRNFTTHMMPLAWCEPSQTKK